MNVSFQSETSTSCGKFVLYFIFERLFNQDINFEDLLEEIFVQDVHTNEKRIETFFEDLMGS